MISPWMDDWVERGFDFLGYHLTLEKITPAKTTIENFKRRIARLYEQGADSIRIGRYVQNWLQWLYGGLGMLQLSFVEIFFSGQTCETEQTDP